jgi:hypothetical protein
MSLTFARFGNAFAATGADDTLYVISLYMSTWGAWYAAPGDEKPTQIGRYGYPTPEDAQHAAKAFDDAGRDTP